MTATTRTMPMPTQRISSPNAMAERYALVAEASDSGIWERTNLTSGEEWWSPRLYELLGYDPGTFTPGEAGLSGLVHPLDQERTTLAMERHVDGVAPLDLELRIRTGLGTYRWFKARGAILRDPDGMARRYTGTLTDIHDRRVAVSELERFIKLSGELICVIDVDGHFSRVSPSFTDALGYGTAELLELPMADLIHPDDLECTALELEQTAANRGTRSFDCRFRLKSGGWAWLAWSARSDSTGSIHAIGRNVTEARTAKDKLAKRAAELELTNQELEQFANIATHDLQEPLRTVVSYAGLVNDRYADLLDEDGRKFLTFMGDAASHMRALLQALLDYSRLGRCRVEPIRMEIGDVVRAALAGFDAEIEEAGMKVCVGELPELTVDPQLFPLVVEHLVSNAIKFRAAEDPELSISAERTHSGWRFDVVDNGIGIKDEYKERVFEVFKRLNGRARYEGTGIGLAVCRRVVQRHGGTIWCSPLGKRGTAFRFTLPFETNLA